MPTALPAPGLEYTNLNKSGPKAIIALLCTGITASAQVVITTPNLLVNPGAEAGNLTGWTVIGGAGNTVPTVDSGTYDPGLNPHTGGYQFVGDHYPGGGGAQGFLYQSVDISTWSVAVDNGAALAKVGFWEQSYNQGSASDFAHVQLTFLGSGSGVLGTATTPDFSSTTGWTNFNGSYQVPTGTRSVIYTMEFYRANNGGTYIDSFFDDNSLALTVPEPGFSVIAASLGLMGLGIWFRTRAGHHGASALSAKEQRAETI